MDNTNTPAHVCRQHHTDPTKHTYDNSVGTYTVDEFRCDQCAAVADFRCRQCGTLYFKEVKCPSCGNNNWEFSTQE